MLFLVGVACLLLLFVLIVVVGVDSCFLVVDVCVWLVLLFWLLLLMACLFHVCRIDVCCLRCSLWLWLFVVVFVVVGGCCVSCVVVCD